MALQLKTGLGEPRVFGLQGPIILALLVAIGVWEEFGQPCVLTAGIDGKHSAGSSHYTGNGIDLRTSGFTPEEKAAVLERLRARLTSDYFCQLESDHIHIQFKPQRAYTS